MAKRYKVCLDDIEYQVYEGQIWISEGRASYLKIESISERKGQRLALKCRMNKGEDAREETFDLDDLVLWILDNKAKPLVVSYEAY